MFARLRAILVLGFALVLCAAHVWSQDDHPATLRISGRVVDPASFQIPNVDVALKIVGMDQPLMKVVTDGNGIFTFPAVPSNAYELHFEAIGFAPVTLDAAQVMASGTVVMRVGRLRGIWKASPSIGIFGRLIDPSGAAVSNAVVTIQPPKPEQITVAPVRVDQEGKFVSSAASLQGTYEFRFSAPGFKSVTKQSVPTKGYIEVGTVVMPIGDVTDAPMKTTLCEAVNNSNRLTGHFVEVRTEIHASEKGTPMTLVLYDSSCSAVVLGPMLDGRSINATDKHTLRKNLDQHHFVEATVLGKFEPLSTPVGSYRYRLTIHSISGVAVKSKIP